MDETTICRAVEIIDACLFLSERELVIGTWGNVSARLDGDRFLLTPSAVDFEELRPDDLVEIAAGTGARIGGTRIPSSEKELHRMIYLAREDVRCIMHDHSVYASAVSALGTAIPAVNEEMAQMFGGEIPCTQAYVPAGRHLALGEAAAKSLGSRARGVLLRNHGLVVCGRNFEECKTMCLIAEKAAKIFLHLRSLPYSLISEEDCESEHERFLCRYGTAADSGEE